MISIRDSVRASVAESRVDSSRTEQSRAETDHSSTEQRREAAKVLACFEELAGKLPSALDQETAREFAASSVAAERIVERMRDRAKRMGTGWRPSTLHYFQRMVQEMEHEQAKFQIVASVPEPNAEVGWCAACANAGLVADRSHPVQSTYLKCPRCHGTPPVDPDPPLELWAKYPQGFSMPCEGS